MKPLAVLRADAKEIFAAGLRAAEPFAAIKNNVNRSGDYLQVSDRRYLLPSIKKIFVVGCGKAAARMALALEDILGDRIAGGVVITKYGHGLALDKIMVVEAGHPIPDESGVAGARQIVNLIRTAGGGDLVIFLISGGGSALFPYPVDEVTLEEKRQTTQLLLDSGATIHELNAVRKHISKVKGGRFAKLAAPAQIVSLILSDVVGDSLDTIASGPTVPDSTTYSDCLEIIRRYQLAERIPQTVSRLLELGAEGTIEETPKPGDAIFNRVQNVIVGNNRAALEAAKRQAESLGYHSMILSSNVEGESRDVAVSLATLAKQIARTSTPLSRPACVISGGETTVRVHGDGLGGRNQEFALSVAIEIDGTSGIVALSAGTDGTDGPSDAAGAVVDGMTVQRGLSKRLSAANFLRRNDSYHFLQATDDLLITGPTFTNVMDLQVMLID